MRRVNRQSQAFTLVEIMISIFFVMLVGLAILGVHMMVRKSQRFERERIVMLIKASEKVESLKSKYYYHVAASVEPVLVDVNNTPLTTADDMAAQLRVRLWNKTGGEITSTTQAPNNNDAVLVNVSITWTAVNKQHRQDLWTILAPI